jgi:hypothetical protein
LFVGLDAAFTSSSSGRTRSLFFHSTLDIHYPVGLDGTSARLLCPGEQDE